MRISVLAMLGSIWLVTPSAHALPLSLQLAKSRVHLARVELELPGAKARADDAHHETSGLHALQRRLAPGGAKRLASDRARIPGLDDDVKNLEADAAITTARNAALESSIARQKVFAGLIERMDARSPLASRQAATRLGRILQRVGKRFASTTPTQRLEALSTVLGAEGDAGLPVERRLGIFEAALAHGAGSRMKDVVEIYELSAAVARDGFATRTSLHSGVAVVFNPSTGLTEIQASLHSGIAGVWNPVTQTVEWKSSLHSGIAGAWNPVEQKVEWKSSLHSGVAGVWNPVTQTVEWKSSLHSGIAGVWSPVKQTIEWKSSLHSGIAGAWNSEKQEADWYSSFHGGVAVATPAGASASFPGTYEL